jgi:hypothetical protein
MVFVIYFIGKYIKNVKNLFISKKVYIFALKLIKKIKTNIKRINYE